MAFAQVAPLPGAIATPVPAQTTSGGDVEVGAEESRWRLVYSVNRTPERPFDTTRAVQVINREDIWRKAARTLPELLMNEVGLFVQQTNYGGGSPIVRGLMGKQVVILVDGVRINNATFRFGPLQYLNTIDLSSVERIEIVRGVESVLGSDALAGAVNIILKKGPPAQLNQPFGGTVSTRFSTADMAVTGHAEVFDRIGRLRYSAGATYRDTGDVRPGGGLPVQHEQAYDERAAAVGAEYCYRRPARSPFGSIRWARTRSPAHRAPRRRRTSSTTPRNSSFSRSSTRTCRGTASSTRFK